ncbi:serine peptidase inhibitor, Kunitz type 4 [Phyllostomus discolor]|uniref:Serine peptidase inhibitor, Kunitz type 4 n=1 Tax=Phyllostomus discolor TaxID=89673 RepID=A0A833Z5R8_9CHIR|nr:serine peptidase inhibitor, Kunitz type 4 [Phyllostomus discolor]
MKPAELRFLLGLLIFSLQTMPLMGGVERVSQRMCEDLKDPCRMEMNVGSCYEIHFRYFYNYTSKRCQSFLFTGCDGNLNNYKLKIECQIMCEEEFRTP